MAELLAKDKSTSKDEQERVPDSRVAFVSGHIDLPQATFNLHYKARLDSAVQAGDFFIVSTARGADTLALEYLLAAGVSPDRITVYLNSPPPPRTQGQSGMILGQTTMKEWTEKYEARGLEVRVVKGDHTARDAVMTEESDYDILWVRSEEETRAMYGKKYRAGRVSGTEKNRLRRIKVFEKERVEK